MGKRKSIFQCVWIIFILFVKFLSATNIATIFRLMPLCVFANISNQENLNYNNVQLIARGIHSNNNWHCSKIKRSQKKCLYHHQMKTIGSIRMLEISSLNCNSTNSANYSIWKHHAIKWIKMLLVSYWWASEAKVEQLFKAICFNGNCVGVHKWDCFGKMNAMGA